MITLTVENKGAQAEIKIPIVAGDILFSDYLDYKKKKELYNNLDEDIRNAAPVSYLKEAILHIVKVESGDFDIIPPYLPDDLVEKGKIPHIYEKISLLRLDNHISKIVNEYKTEDSLLKKNQYSFKYKNKVFFVGRQRSIVWMTKMAFTTGEVVNVVEIDTLMDLLIEKKGDPKGNYEYEKELKVVAILARKQNEKLPSNISQKMEFMEYRMKYFKDLPLNIVLDIRFFLRGILIELLMTRITIGTLTNRITEYQKSILQQKTPRRGRRLKKQGGTMKKDR